MTSRDRFQDRKKRVAQKLPPFEDILRGSVVVRSLRCGKPGCHCAKDAGHPATYLSVGFPGGTSEQISLPASLVPDVRRRVAAYRAWWAAIEKVSALNRQILRLDRAELSAPPRKRRRR